MTSDAIVDTLSELTHLVHLDLSDEPEIYNNGPVTVPGPNKLNVNDLLLTPGIFLKIKSLDISGRDMPPTPETLADFVTERRDTLEFLGLAMLDLCTQEIFTCPRHPRHNPALRVAGSGNECQILEALTRYYPNRPTYTQKNLYALFRQTQNFTQPRVDIIDVSLAGRKTKRQKSIFDFSF